MRVKTSLWMSILALAAAACSGAEDGGRHESDLPADLSDTPVHFEMPCLDFYGEDARSAIIERETALGHQLDVENSGTSLVFRDSADEAPFPETVYQMNRTVQLATVRLFGKDRTTVWNRALVLALQSGGYVITAWDDWSLTMENEASGIRVRFMRMTSDNRSLLLFSPMREQREPASGERRVIHPFHALGSSLEAIYRAELASGRELKVLEADRLYATYPEQEGTMYELFGFFMYEGRLDHVMALVRDGDYLDTAEFRLEMEATGFVFLRESGSYKFYLSLDGKTAVRTANLQPGPSIEYLDPDSPIVAQ